MKLRNPSACGSRTAKESTSVSACVASVRPGVNETSTLTPAAFAAASIAAQPPRTMRSASDTFLFFEVALNSAWIFSSPVRTTASSVGLLAAQLRCGSRRMRAPLAPPRLSVPRKVEAEAQAVETSWLIERPEFRINSLSTAIFLSPITS